MAGCSCDSTLAPDAGDAIRRVLWFALIANASMFLVEASASYFADSMSMQADAMDFFGDAFSYAVTLAVVGSALALRARAALLKGLMMAAFGLLVLAGAGWRAVGGSEPEPMTMGWIAVLALAVNVTVAALLFRFRTGDANLKSIWLCSRNDAIGNVAVMMAAAGVLATSSRWPDLAVAVLIAGINLTSAIQVVRAARAELVIAETPHPVTPAPVS